MKKPIPSAESLFAKLVPAKARKSDDLRRKIVETFISLVYKAGLEATSVDDIAKQLKMRRNHVGYYFPSGKRLRACKWLPPVTGERLLIPGV
jgi:hypothetical protein